MGEIWAQMSRALLLVCLMAAMAAATVRADLAAGGSLQRRDSALSAFLEIEAGESADPIKQAVEQAEKAEQAKESKEEAKEEEDKEVKITEKAIAQAKTEFGAAKQHYEAAKKKLKADNLAVAQYKSVIAANKDNEKARSNANSKLE